MSRFRIPVRIAHPRLAALASGVVVAALAGSVYASGLTATQAQPDSVARGATVFQNNCQVCHGIQGQGNLGVPLYPLPPEIANAPREVLVQELGGLVRGGIPGAMPRFVPEQVSDADVAALVDWFLETNKNLPSGRSYYEALQPVGQVASTAERLYFPETGHTVAGGFKAYWEQNGGVRIFGFPISEEYVGISSDGKYYTMQVFERARFEYHPEADPEHQVQLAVLGLEERQRRMHFLLRREQGR